MNYIRKNSGENVFRKITSMREMIMVIVIAGLFIIMSFGNQYFLTSQTMLNVLMSFTVEGVIAIGMVILLVSGGLDLSVGANMGFTGIVTGLLVVGGVPMVLAIVIGLSVGLGVGLANGFLIAKIGLNPLITTLGTGMTFTGLMMMLTKGKSIIIPKSFSVIGTGSLFGIQYPVYILIALVIIFEILLRKTRLFRASYYVGGNESAARLNGINVPFIKLFNYGLTGLLAGLTGIVLSARLTTASVSVGGNTALEVITACIIGGASLSGGEGSVLGAFLGVAFIQLLSTSLDLSGVDVYTKTFVTGLILIAAITIDVFNEKRKAKKIVTSAQKCLDDEDGAQENV